MTHPLTMLELMASDLVRAGSDVLLLIAGGYAILVLVLVVVGGRVR